MTQVGIRRRLAKWAGWGLRLQARFCRRSGAFRTAMLLHLRHARAGAIFEQRWTRYFSHFGTRLHWSILTFEFSKNISAVPQASPVRTEIARMRGHARHAPAARLETLMAPAARLETLMKVVAGPRHELSKVLLRQQAGTAFERRFSLQERVDAQFHTSARVTEHHHSHRTERALSSPMVMTLRREHVAVASPESRKGTAVQERSSAIARPGDLPPLLQQAAAAAAINLDQMTDHVIRQLDRRVVARRERMGRV